ncbi:ABC transporter substrate-binding protein [Motilimonas cestriensis]|uniref:ABC transporter substrate-binding protein n=1 Tax=Motilimonas cestriensis TaxID=2742685 RepID=A0ABS8W2M4_9GAMM|nr:ABC transporter substrate-binding protein [Motilimonas cestriensis]MCE2593212.1 ABC transporter substrate-binding protein [Motilimonas cestriensis]
MLSNLSSIMLQLLAITLLCLLEFTKPVMAEKVDIVTTTPVTLMLSQALTVNTPLQTNYVAPARYGLSRLPNWFKQHSEKMAPIAKQAKVVVTLGSVWAQDPLYLALREYNIQIIEVDAAQALRPNARGVVYQRTEQGVSPYVWLNSANLVTMAKIVSHDFQQIWPKLAPVIAQNEADLLIKIKALRLSQQAYVAQHQLDAVVLLSPELEDLAAGLQLYVLHRQFKPALSWSEADKKALAKILSEPYVRVLSTQALSNKHPLNELVTPEQWWQVDAIDRLGRQGIDEIAPLKRWQF